MPTSLGMIQGYNAQTLVNEKHQIIVHAEPFSSQDHENLAPMMSGANKNMRAIGKEENYFAGKQLSADSNYQSYASLVLWKTEDSDAYIPDIQFRKRNGRFAGQPRFKDGIHPRMRQTRKTGKFSAADFSFDESKQTYICPQGKALICHARSQRNRYRLYDIYHIHKFS